MWAYILRKILYNIPVYLGIILLLMVLLRVNDPVYAFLGKSASPEQIQVKRHEMGLDRPFLAQYRDFVWDILRMDFSQRSWEQKRPVGQMIRKAVGPSLAITAPSLFLTAIISVTIGLIASFYRGRSVDRTLMLLAVLGMCVSYLVYIILGQYFGAYWPRKALGTSVFAVSVDATVGDEAGYFFVPANWVRFCMLPVLINLVVAMGYDTRFYRAVMVEEGTRDYIITAKAKGASKRKIMFVHMLKNAMIPIVTRVMITLPFLITGSILVEMYFGIPGMGRTLINAINAKDFPVIQAITALLAAVMIVTVILTDVLYALLDPRVRLQ